MSGLRSLLRRWTPEFQVFGLASDLGNVFAEYAFIVIIAGAIFHVWGMYIVQMGHGNQRNNAVAKYYGFLPGFASSR